MFETFQSIIAIANGAMTTELSQKKTEVSKYAVEENIADEDRVVLETQYEMKGSKLVMF